MRTFIPFPSDFYAGNAWKKASKEHIMAYIDLCFRVVNEEIEYDCMYGKVKIERGQMIVSKSRLGEFWHTTPDKAWCILGFLVRNGLVTKEVVTQKGTQQFAQFTLLTVNYMHKSSTQQSTQQSTQDSIDNKDLSKDKSTNTGEGKRRFVKPTPEEVQKELDRRGITAFTGMDFWSYYETSGWKVGHGNPMKSWQYCINTWLRYERNNGTNKSKGAADRARAKAERARDVAKLVASKLSVPDGGQQELPF